MQKIRSFVLLLGIFVYSCSPSSGHPDTKTESASVNNTTQPMVTSDKPIETPPASEKTDNTPENPLPPTGATEVTKTNTPEAATISQPSPERTNVSPAKEVATEKKSPQGTTTATKENNRTTPTTRTEEVAADTKDVPPLKVDEPEEKIEAIASKPPVSSGETATEKLPVTPPTLSHSTWDELLRANVSSTGKVNYKGLKAAQSKLKGYLENLQNNPPQSSWSRNKTMAYWINAYNAFTVQLILNNYPVSSITKLEGGKPWDKKWIKLGDKTYSLNQIENDILRPVYKDARIHFAVNCAAKSCPPLLNRAWTADNLNSNFEKQAKAFINNASFNSIGSKSIEVSKIFEWYAVDFDNLIDYLNKYANTKIEAGAKISYKEYNWNLNE